MTYKKVDQQIIRRIGSIIQDHKHILTEKHDLAGYSFDASFGTYFPELVLQPLTTEEVAQVVRIANEECIPIYPRGQSTSLSGGPLPIEGGIVLDLSRMNQVLEVILDDLIAVVSPGVLTADIHAAASKVGLMYPPDPSSSQVSTIGGNLAENSGGPKGLKYGVTKDYVLGLEVVTPQGDNEAFAAGVLCMTTIDLLANMKYADLTNKRRYVKWLHSEIPVFNDVEPGFPNQTLGELFYKDFRCGLVHEGRITRLGQFSYLIGVVPASLTPPAK